MVDQVADLPPKKQVQIDTDKFLSLRAQADEVADLPPTPQKMAIWDLYW